MRDEVDVIALARGASFHDRYEVVRRMSTGGMGVVYEVIDDKTRKHRALKVMLPDLVKDADLRARFRLEATIVAGIESDHLVDTVDAGVDEATGLPFLVMELLSGNDLSSELKRRGRLPSAEVVTLAWHAALALDKTGAAGVVHRDLKPENLFVTRGDDGAPRLKVLDFGVAKLVAEGATHVRTTRALGSPLYMSPEQVEGDGLIGPAADLYALGHIVYTLLVGEAYFSEESRKVHQLLLAILRGASEPASARAERSGGSLPPAFDAWFARSTSIRPAERFKTAPKMVEALAVVLDVALPARAQGHTDAAPNDVREDARSPSEAEVTRACSMDEVSSSVTTAPEGLSPATLPVARSPFWIALGGVALFAGGVTLTTAIRSTPPAPTSTEGFPLSQASLPSAPQVSSAAPAQVEAVEAPSAREVMPVGSAAPSTTSRVVPQPPLPAAPKAPSLPRPAPEPAVEPPGPSPEVARDPSDIR